MTNSEAAGSAVSVAAIASPAWLPSLHTISVAAAEWLPILGAICLGLQGILWAMRIWRTYKQ